MVGSEEENFEVFGLPDSWKMHLILHLKNIESHAKKYALTRAHLEPIWASWLETKWTLVGSYFKSYMKKNTYSILS